MNLTITQPSVENLNEINQLIVASKQSWGYSDELIRSWLPILQATEQSLLEREYWIARNELDEAVFLYSFSKHSEQLFELEDCWIAPEFKGKGLGRKLFCHLRSKLAEQNAQMLTITAEPNAEGFYLRMGAQRVGEKQSNVPGRVLPILELTLNSQKNKE